MTEARSPRRAPSAALLAAQAEERSSHAPRGGLAALTIGALGVVYGDIGTSPLYAIDQISRSGGVAPTPENVLGAISLVIWTLTLIVAIKYALLVLRAQNDGEGGVFALYGLLHDYKNRGARVLLWSLMLGAGLLFGDGMITPAISVLSAVEGLDVATPGLGALCRPDHHRAADRPVRHPVQGRLGDRRRLRADPGRVVRRHRRARRRADRARAADPRRVRSRSSVWRSSRTPGCAKRCSILGALMLVVTGGEAMYADLGHFGARPIRISWFAIVFPALLANYLGQGAYLLSGAPVVGGKLFYCLAPAAMLFRWCCWRRSRPSSPRRR